MGRYDSATRGPTIHTLAAQTRPTTGAWRQQNPAEKRIQHSDQTSEVRTMACRSCRWQIMHHYVLQIPKKQFLRWERQGHA